MKNEVKEKKSRKTFGARKVGREKYRPSGSLTNVPH